MKKVTLIQILIITLSIFKSSSQELEHCTVKFKVPYRTVKLELNMVSIINKQFLQILDSLVNYEKKCDSDVYLECKHFWEIIYDKETQDGFFLYLFLISSFDNHSPIGGYSLIGDSEFLFSKEILEKNLDFISKTKEKKIIVSKPPLEPYAIEDLPEWLLYYSYKSQKFYIIESSFTRSCD